MQGILFKLDQEEFCFDIQDVQEIVRLQEHTKLPSAPKYVEGVINLRDEIIPVLDLAGKFKLPAVEETASARLIILNLKDDGLKRVAVKATEVTEVRDISHEAIEGLPEFSQDRERVLAGVAKLEDRLVIMLDARKVADFKELDILEHKATILDE